MKQQQKFYFGGAFYLQVLQGLYRTLSERNVALLLGESGVGKSSLCDKLRQYLLRQNDSVLFLSEPPSSPEILRSILARELDLPDTASLAVLLSDALLSRSDDAAFKPLTLILDDAHLLSDVTLMELAQLSVARVNEEPALRLLLSGEPTLAERLARHPDLSELWQVINEGAPALYQLEPMRSEELKDFLQEYLRQSGRPEHQLSGESIQRLHKSCQGYPGQALKLAAQLEQEDFVQTLAGYSATSVTAGVLPEEHSGHSPAEVTGGRMRSWLAGAEHRQTRALLPVAAVVVLASLGFIYQQLAGTDDQASVASDEVPQQVVSDPLDDYSSQVLVNPTVDVDTATSPFVAVPVVEEQVEQQSGTDLAAVTDVEEPASAPPMSEEQQNRQALLAAIERARVAAQEQLASDQSVSDSGLVLVTAAERGISEDSFGLPDIDALLEAEEDDPATQPVPEPVAEGAAEVAEEVAEVATSHANEAGVSIAAVDEAASASVAEPESVQGEPASGGVWRDRVAGWVSAWQDQDLEAYFAYYHDRFVPRYQNSLTAWRSNRERVIGGATDIELEMYDFDVISESPDEVEVHFWLDYRSPSYQDQTRKKLVLAPFQGSWLIIEEINLEVRA